jgi:chromosome segregation ATPase
LEERRRNNVDLAETQRQVDGLRDELRKSRSDAARAAVEAQGMVDHLEATLAKERGLAATLKTEVNDLTRRHNYLEQSADRRVFELTQELDVARQETARAKGEMVEMRGMLDEADFAHRALKEGGARLVRELAERERKVEELEKNKSAKRWGMI